MREREEKKNKYFASKTGQEDSLNITIFDSRCQNCQVIHENIRCNQKEHVCALNGTCHEQGSIHPGDICQHCIEGRWRPKSGKGKTRVVSCHSSSLIRCTPILIWSFSKEYAMWSILIQE